MAQSGDVIMHEMVLNTDKQRSYPDDICSGLARLLINKVTLYSTVWCFCRRGCEGPFLTLTQVTRNELHKIF